MVVVPTRKHKGFPYDTYECVECGRIWSSRSIKIGHTAKACKAYSNKQGW